MIKIKPTPKNIISVLAICDLLTKKEKDKYLQIISYIREKSYRKNSLTYWRILDNMIKPLSKELQEDIINDIENEIVLREIMQMKSLFVKFLNEIISEAKAIKQEAIKLLSKLQTAKEDKALQIKELLSQLTTFLQLQREHSFIDQARLEALTYYRKLSLHP